MRKNYKLFGRRTLSIALALVFIAGVFVVNPSTVKAWAADPGAVGNGGANSGTATNSAGFVSDDNGYIKYYVNEGDGSYYIMPSSQKFDANKTASFAMFRIGGQTYRFGDSATGAQGMIPPQKNSDGTTQTTWYVKDYAVTQYLNIIQEDGYVDSYAVYVGYSIRYDGGGANDASGSGGSAAADPVALTTGGGKVDARMVLDTQFGPGDDQPVLVQGSDSSISHETKISPAPQYYQTDETVTGEGPYAYGQLSDSRFTSPTALTVARFGNLVNGGFDYKPDAGADFTAAGGADSGIALDFSADLTGKSGDSEAVSIGTIYGFRGLADASAPPDQTATDKAAAGTAASGAADSALKAMTNAKITPMNATDVGSFPTVSGDRNDGVYFPVIQDYGIYFGTYRHALETTANSTYDNPVSSYEASATPISWAYAGEETTDHFVQGNGDGYLTFMTRDILDSLPFDTGGSGCYAGSGIRQFLDGTATAALPASDPNPIKFTDNFNPAELDAAARIPVYTTWYPVGGYSPPATYVNQVADQPFYLPLPPATAQLAGTWSSPFNASDNGSFWLNDLSRLYGATFFPTALKSGGPDIGVWTRMQNTQSEEVNVYTDSEGFLNTADPASNNGIAPLFKLDPATVIDITTADGAAYTETPGAFQLTLLGGNGGSDVGTLSIAGLPSSPVNLSVEPAAAPDVSIAGAGSSVTLSGMTAVPHYENPGVSDPEDYSVNYKIVDDEAPGRMIVSSGSDNNVSDASLSVDFSGLYLDKTYDVYVWLQRNNSENSNEATDPLHFQVNLARAAYTVTSYVSGGSSLTIKDTTGSSGPYISGDTVTLSNITIPTPATNKYQINVYYDKNGAKANVNLTDNGDGTYSFVMPPGNTEVHMDVFSKDSPVITVQPNPQGNVTLSPSGGPPGTVIQLTAQNTDPNYVVTSADLYATQSVLDQATGQTSIQETPLFGTGSSSVSFMAANTGSFTIPADIGQNNILIKLNTASMPVNTVSIPSSLTFTDASFGSHTFNLVPDNGDGTWTNNGSTWSTGKFKPGQQVSVKLTSSESYWGFDVSGVDFKGNPVDYSENVYNSGGLYSDTISFVMPAFTGLGNWVDGNIGISLTPKKIYQPYSVASVTPDSGAFANFTSLTVTGTELEQVVGQGLDYSMLTPQQQAAAKVVTFGGNPAANLNPVIPAGDIKLQADGSLLITVPQATLQSLTNANGTFYLSLGSTTRTITLDMNYQLRYTPFGVLGVVGDSSHSYRVELGDSDADLLQRAGGDTIALKVKGTVSFDQKTNTYSFKQGQVVVGNIVVYSIPADNDFTVKASGGTVSVSGTGGTLSLPGFNTGVTTPVNCTVQKGVTYRSDVFAQTTDSFDNVTISWNYTAPGSVQKGLKIATMLGLTANVNDLRLLDSAVAFGGTLDLNLPENLAIVSTADKTIANIAIQQLQYGLNSSGLAVFQGVRATGAVQMPNTFKLSFMDFDAQANATVDTFSNNYHLDGDVNFHLFEANGGITLKPSYGYLIPDSVNVFFGADEGIEIIPGVLQLQGLGGGYSGLADTINGNFGYIPPFTLSTQGRLSIIELITYDGGQTIGPSEFSGHGAVSVGKSVFSVNLGSTDWGLYNYDDGSVVSASQHLDLVSGFDVISGSGSATIGYRKDNGGFIFSGSLYASIQIPKFKVLLFWFGPYTIGSVNCSLSSQGASGSVRVLSLVSFGFSYNWGDSSPSIHSLSAPTPPKTGDSLANTQPVYDKDGKQQGTVTFGTNLKLVTQGSADGPSKGIAPLADATGNGVDPTVQVITNNLKANEFIMTDIPRDNLQVEYSPDSGGTWLPYTLYFPRSTPATDDNPYTEAELNAAWVNAIDQTNNGETSIMLMPDPSLSAYWRLTDTTGGNFTYDIIEATPIPEISNATLTGSTLDWSADGLDPTQHYMIDVSLSLNDGSAAGSGEAQYPIVQNQDVDLTGITASGGVSGSIQIDPSNFPENMPSGDYHAVVTLKTYTGTSNLLDSSGNPVPDGAGGVVQQVNADNDSVQYSTGTYSYTNLLQPGAVQSIAASAAGNGALKAEWTGVGSDVNYQITAFDSSGNQVMSPPQTVTDANGNPQSVTLPYVYNVTPDMYSNATGQITAILTGLPAGADYKLVITPYRYIDPADTTSPAVMGQSTESALVNLPTPNYPKVTATFGNAVTNTDGQGNLSVFASSDYTINLSADQACVFTVTEDGKTVYKSASPENSHALDRPIGSGSTSRYVVIQAVNAAGDQGVLYYNAYYDNVKPTLFIDTVNGTIAADKNGNFTVTGSTKPGATVSLYMNKPVSVQAGMDGSFKLSGILPASAKTGVLSLSALGAGSPSATGAAGLTLITVGSTDAVGNTVTANINVAVGTPNTNPTPNKPSSGGTAGDGVQTRDAFNPALWWIVAALGALGTLYLTVWRRRRLWKH